MHLPYRQVLSFLLFFKIKIVDFKQNIGLKDSFNRNYLRMKKIAILLLAGIFSGFFSYAQTANAREKEKQPMVTCIDFGIGYIPDKAYQNVTVSVAGNNLLWDRLGAYTMAELDFDALAVVLGPTFSINHFSYVFAGIDFFTSRGLINLNVKEARKDFGIGFYPWKWATVKVCYSFSAGPRAEVGLRFPLTK